MKRFENAQVDDKVYCRINGLGIIVEISKKTTRYPIIVNFPDDRDISYTRQGKMCEEDEEAILFYVDVDNKYAEKRPIPSISTKQLPVDFPIVVDGVAYRHYAGKNSYFADGRTSFSARSNSQQFMLSNNRVVLGKEIKIKGITYPKGTPVIIEKGGK